MRSPNPRPMVRPRVTGSPSARITRRPSTASIGPYRPSCGHHLSEEKPAPAPIPALRLRWMAMPRPAASTASSSRELRASGYADRSVKEELRANLLARLDRGQPLFPRIVGFEDSVVPALERGILAGHDLMLLGERGQAKTRLIRHLVELLDEWTPVISGCEVNDHPFRPICARCRALVAAEGDEIPIAWLPRDRRY